MLPDQPESANVPPDYDADKYDVVSAFTAPTARWRRWTMPDAPLPSAIPPYPPDLTVNRTPDGGFPYGDARGASLWFDPADPATDPVKLWTDRTGVRLFGGQPEREGWPCDNRRIGMGWSTGDRRVTTDTVSMGYGEGYLLEVYPYTNPWAPFNPQSDQSPRGDSLTVNPAYMDEFRNFDEDLRALYQQLSIDEPNGREKGPYRC